MIEMSSGALGISSSGVSTPTADGPQTSSRLRTQRHGTSAGRASGRRQRGRRRVKRLRNIGMVREKGTVHRASAVAAKLDTESAEWVRALADTGARREA